MAAGQGVSEKIPVSVNKLLGGKGSKLHSHEVHLRRTDNGGYVAHHQLRDKHGSLPSDGQRSEAEYALADKAAMLAHIEQHMTDAPGQDDDEEQQPQGAPQQGPVQ